MGELKKRIKKFGIFHFLAYIPHYIYEKYHELRLGIYTSGYISSDDLGVEDSDCNAYEPCSYATLFKAIKALPISYENDVFIDYGSGKGRACIVAATAPFSRVIGVELSEKLNKAAERNFVAAKRRGVLKCQVAEFITINAFDYEPPDDASVVFLYNPFSEEFMKDVVNKLVDSVNRFPRKLHIIFKYPDWSRDFLAEDSRFEFVTDFYGYSDANEVGKIYRLK